MKKIFFTLTITIMMFFVTGCSNVISKNNTQATNTVDTSDLVETVYSADESIDEIRDAAELESFSQLVSAIANGHTEDDGQLSFNIYVKKVLVRDFVSAQPKWQVVIGSAQTNFDSQWSRELTLYAENEFYDPFKLDNVGAGPYWPAVTIADTASGVAYSGDSIYRICTEEAESVFGQQWYDNIEPYETYVIYTFGG